MKKIEENIWSYSDTEHFKLRGGVEKTERFELTTISKIRKSRGHVIKNFRELIINVTTIARMNNHFDTFFRGQKEDKTDKNGRTIIYPTICRPERNQNIIRTKNIENRFSELNDFCDYFKYYSLSSNSYLEYYYALIQHYELFPTTLIDITQSVRTAATFALENNERKIGYFYVIGLPYPRGSISHFIDLNITLVKLQSVCPSDAHRPHYQEGFLVGKLPFNPKKEAGDNLARRLLAKFQLDNSSGNFWDSDFKPLPENLIRPEKDKFGESLKYHHDNFKAQQ